MNLLSLLVTVLLLPWSIQGHGEGEWNSPNATVSVDLTDDDRTSLQIQLDEDMCTAGTSTNNVGLLCTINITLYAGTAECPVYNLSVVEGDVTYHCSHHGDEMSLLFLNKYGCEANPFVNVEEEDISAVVVDERSDTVNTTPMNTTTQNVNETSMMNVFGTAASVSGHACKIQKIENVRINGEEIVYSWENPTSSSWTQKSTSWLYLSISLVVVHSAIVAYII